MTTPIPLTAWEQFGIVVLVLVFASAFLGGVWAFIRWILNWLDRITEKQRTSQNEFFDEQRRAQEKFVATENEKTKIWLAQQETSTRKVIGQVNEGMEAVNDSLRELARQLTQHDNNVEHKFNEAVATITNGHGNKIPDRRKSARPTAQP